jgi:hypothetical protein
MNRMIVATVLICVTAAPALAQNEIEITTRGDQRCFTANGLPDHPTGQFPSRANPNVIEPQRVYMCVPLEPVRTDMAQQMRGAVGIAVNGVQFRPTTAGYWDPEARRSHSRNGDQNWSLDIFGTPGQLGLDFNNAHVGPNGLYHYHGIAESLTETSGSTLVGYAGDGFEMHFVGDAAQSGYRLVQGTRPLGPGGRYDGTYNEDYEYAGGVGTLDACNGGIMDGEYVYFITESYPFVGRCLWGDIGPDFGRGGQ